jgi:sulfocyanin
LLPALPEKEGTIRMGLSRKRVLTHGLALTTLLAGSLVIHHVAAAASTPTWVTTSGATVHLTVIAGYNNTNAGFNFNGAAHGQMVVTVPLGDTVDATFRNAAKGGFHDVVIIPYTMPLPGAGIKPAFAGAASPLPQFRPGAGGAPPNLSAPQSFSFTASKAGTYMMICGIAGHALAGMWDTFIVSSTAKTASVTFNQAGVASTPPASTPPSQTSGLISTKGSTVTLMLIAGYNNANAGFNFDGGAHGKMVVTVPLGDKINAIFKSNVTTPHDVLIVPFQSPPPSHSVATAFPGASSSRGFGSGGGARRRGGNGQGGNGGPPGGFTRPKPGTPMPFSFVANKAGTYMIICGVPGHALAGMWDIFVVSSTAKTASITFKS